MKWMFLPLKRYADFSGRSRRKEYWMFFLFQIIVHTMLFGLFFIAEPQAATTDADAFAMVLVFAMVIWIFFALATFIPNMAVIVRRLHDQDIPGIVGILLYIGTFIFTLPGLVILVLMAREGVSAENEYGIDPKLDDNVGDVFR